MHYLRIFTFLDQAELDALATAHESDPGRREAHIALAREVTKLVHGEAGVAAAERIAEAMFSNRIDSLDAADMAQLAQDGLPATRVDVSEVPLLEMLVTSGLAVTPKGEVTQGQARKLIQSNAVSVNGAKVSDIDMQLSSSDAFHGQYMLIQKGKKNHHLVVFAREAS